jgi:hypothetical protein
LTEQLDSLVVVPLPALRGGPARDSQEIADALVSLAGQYDKRRRYRVTTHSWALVTRRLEEFLWLSLLHSTE